jgi:arsenite-transporting ATPase
MRVIIYTGKGGVGKTSISGATALGAAAQGHRTLVLSTDTAHSLGDSFDLSLSEKPKRLVENLWAMEVNVVYEMEKNYRKFLDYWAAVNESRGYNRILASELAIFPSMEEVVSMTVVHRYAQEYDVVIVDSGPTADSIRNISFFGNLGGVLSEYARLERLAARTIRPFKDEVWGYPVPADEFYAVWLALLENSETIERMLKSPRITSLRLVVNPEKMVIDESKRAFLYFNLLGINTDAIVLNKILPPAVTGAYYREWKKEHKTYVDLVETSFGEAPVFKAELQRDQVVGIKQLEGLRQELFGEKDPAQVFLYDKPIRFFEKGGRYLMFIKMPFAEARDIKVLRKDGSLLIRVGKYERSFELPWVLRGLDVEHAELNSGSLEIAFEPRGV